ncbi:MAG: hypothetical protein LC650_00825 [Actinobacteria bacterium]|nr:hypothetical protein [Actinomycetota bacterium]
MANITSYENGPVRADKNERRASGNWRFYVSVPAPALSTTFTLDITDEEVEWYVDAFAATLNVTEELYKKGKTNA